MKESLENYAKIGIVYHMLYPECSEDPLYHVKTLLDFINTYDVETFDCCLPFGDEYRKKLIPHLKNCGKEVVFTNHISLMQSVNPSSRSHNERELTKLIYKDQIKTAKKIGAVGYIFSSGRCFDEKYKSASFENFANFCHWLCRKLKKTGITAMLEPFDTTIDKKFLIGPTIECAEFIKSLEIDNLGIELDFAHLPLLGENFYDAIKNTSKYLKRVHLGNCVIRDPSSKWYGDKHPPIGIKNGEIDIEEIAGILSYLLEFGYLNKKNRGPLVLEMRPFDNMGQRETAEDNFKRLYKAWELV